MKNHIYAWAVWTNETLFSHGALDRPLDELRAIPIAVSQHPISVQVVQLSDSTDCFSPFELICKSVAAQSNLDARYKILESNGRTDRVVEADNLMKGKKVESVDYTLVTGNPTKRTRSAQLRKQTTMHNFFTVR